MIPTISPLTLRNRSAGRLASAMAAVVLAVGGCSDSGRGGLAPQPTASVAGVAGPVEGNDRIVAEPATAGSALLPDASSGPGAEDALFTALERVERRVAGAMARVRESVVALEYTPADSPSGARRVATGVVISPQGEILSIRIDRPPPSPPTAPVVTSSSAVMPSPPATSAKGTRGSRSRSGRAGASTIIARDAAGRRHAATWVAADPETGLTLLRIAPNVVRPVRIAADLPKLGSSVFVVGNPFGLGHSVSRGHVAGLDRALELGPRQLGGLTQVQVPLYPGDSGATVANLRGEWLGLIRGGLAASTTPIPAATTTTPTGTRNRDDDPDRDAEMDHDHDIGFAIPARDAIWIADQLRKTGRVDRAYLGVRLESADATEAGVEGARLSEILADSPAAGAGLRTGDRIVALDAHPIRSPADLTDRLDRTRAHTQIKLGVLRRHDQAGIETKGQDDGDGDNQHESDADTGLERLDVSLRASSRPAALFPDPGSGSTGPELGSGEIRGTGIGVGAGIDPAAVVRTASTTTDVAPAPAIATAVPSGPIRAVISKTSASTSSPATLAATTAKATVSTPIPAQRPLPLESRVVPPRPAEIEPISPRAVIERLERIERRIERIERRDSTTPASNPSSVAPKSRD